MSDQSKDDKTRPAKCTEAMLDYLYALRRSGATNMFGAGAYLQQAFKGLSTEEANKILVYWTETFDETRR